MTNILVFGAGKSSSYLIKYLLDCSLKQFWQVTVADSNLNAALAKIGDHSFGRAVQLDIHEDLLRKRQIGQADLVISLLPPSLHFIVAKDCIELRKNLITASYLSEEIKSLHIDARNAGLLFMNEIGLDPGIDHMSAMKIIDEIERLGADISSFKSYCGGLVAPESDNNPWHYKISWNARNILNAGKSGAHFMDNGIEKKFDYSDLFNQYELIKVPGLGNLAAYANRDSLNYRNYYGLEQVKTMLRATFRYEEFCLGWNTIIQLGLTTEDMKFTDAGLTYYDWFMYVTKAVEGNNPSDKIRNITPKEKDLVINLIDWLGLFNNDKINLAGEMSSADILLQRMEEKWKIEDYDKDMVVMRHEFDYARKNIETHLSSTLIVKGEDKTYTAMAKTVGLPMAIFAKLLLTGKIKNLVGVQIPIMKEVYKPVLKELATFGIEFSEEYYA
ncbi:MAG: saccharopine dehydrogenase NADP-binding domain-containing protein [Chitinophagaceae bacterium]|nr:saccharopine dehydrogenase NADP-binding domain-containing protein [Chitinophagaceae bacterium]